MNLNTPIEQLTAVGRVTAKRLKLLGLASIADLLSYYPYRYEDFSQLKTIKELMGGEVVTVKVKIELLANRRSFKKRRILTEGLVSDGTKEMKVLWFNQPYLTKTLSPGMEVLLSGRVDNDRFGLIMISPQYEKYQSEHDAYNTAKILPVYSLTAGLTAKQLRFLLHQTMPMVRKLPEILPEELVAMNNLMSWSQALENIHFPDSFETLQQARKRLNFDEMFLIQLHIQKIRNELEQSLSPLINFNEPETKKFVALLPYSLTDDQKKTAWEIIKDLGRKRPMNRLLQGDVGSGKTVVAALAMLNVGLAGKRTVLMAPTEILAIQHYQSLRKLFAQTGFKIALITSAQREIDGQPLTKKGLNNRLEAEAVEIIVGTHAVIQEKLTIKNLGLVIVDEQHRFGVRQRKHLLRREANQEMPHFLSMTATPIPRTLALALYSDLDLSSIRHLPAGRKKIFTKLINEEKRSRAYEFIREKIKLGQQAFVICPLIDPSDSSGAKSVTEEFQRLKRDVFPDLRLVMLHGKMKSEEKKAVMRAFKNQKFDLLISTSVIEVGVDIPNATIVVIEGAERFGLAQLHQFRGRVGRGIEQSYCFLMPSNENPVTMQRLQALVDCHDGFTLAEKDMEWRGAGEVFGTRQSGLPESGLLDLSDFDIIKKAQQSAIKFWQDFRLEDYPLLQEKYTQKNIIWHFE